MLLKSNEPNHRNMKIDLTGGRVYQTDADGLVEVAHKDDAKRLMTIGWFDVKHPPKAAKKAPPAGKEGGIKLLTNKGETVDKPAPKAAKSAPAPAKEAKAPKKGVKAKPAPTPEPEPEVVDESDESPETAEAEADLPEVLPSIDDIKDGAEWPDPTEGKEQSYLQAMAKAHSIEFNGRTGKATLVARITEAMYG